MARHIIKKYANRRLYDTYLKKPVTIKSIAELIDKGEEIVVIDQKTGKDITSITMAQIQLAKEKEAAYLRVSSSIIIKRNGKNTGKMIDMSIEHTKKVLEEMGKKVREILESTSPPALPPADDFQTEGGNTFTTHIHIPSWNASVFEEIEGIKKEIKQLNKKLNKILYLIENSKYFKEGN